MEKEFVESLQPLQRHALLLLLQNRGKIVATTAISKNKRSAITTMSALRRKLPAEIGKIKPIRSEIYPNGARGSFTLGYMLQ